MSLAQKRTQTLTRDELKKVLSVARGDQVADVLFKNVKILDLVNGEIIDSAIVLSGKTIAGIGLEYSEAKALNVIDAKVDMNWKTENAKLTVV